MVWRAEFLHRCTCRTRVGVWCWWLGIPAVRYTYFTRYPVNVHQRATTFPTSLGILSTMWQPIGLALQITSSSDTHTLHPGKSKIRCNNLLVGLGITKAFALFITNLLSGKTRAASSLPKFLLLHLDSSRLLVDGMDSDSWGNLNHITPGCPSMATYNR